MVRNYDGNKRPHWSAYGFLVSGSRLAINKFKDYATTDPYIKDLLKGSILEERDESFNIDLLKREGQHFKPLKSILFDLKPNLKNTEEYVSATLYFSHVNSENVNQNKDLSGNVVYELNRIINSTPDLLSDREKLVQSFLTSLSLTFKTNALMKAAPEQSGNGPTLREGPRADVPGHPLNIPVGDADHLERIKFYNANESFGLSANGGEGVTVVILDTSPTNPALIFGGGLVDYWGDIASHYFGTYKNLARTPEEKLPERLVTPQFQYFTEAAPKALNRNVPQNQVDKQVGLVGEQVTLDGKQLDHDFMQQYHGLMVAALVRQVAPKATIVLLRVLDDQGEAPNSLITATLNMVCRWIDNPPVEGLNCTPNKLVINLSLGAYNSMAEVVDFEAYLISTDGLCNKGAVIAAASGNFSFANHPFNPTEPAAFGYYDDTTALNQKLITVAATGEEATKFAWFSNQGNLAAPGHDLLIDLVIPVPIDGSGGTAQLFKWSGTSFSTPLVSGAAALLLNSGKTAGEVKQRLWDTATQPKDWNGIKELNLYNALLP